MARAIPDTRMPQRNVLGRVDAGGERRGAAEIRVNPLHHGAVGLADLLRGRPWLKVEYFKGLLKGERATGARARRIAPRVTIALDVFSPTGHPAVEIGFEKADAVRIAASLHQDVA